MDDPRAALRAWQAAGHDRLDPVRFRFLESLARRTEALDGAARRRVDARLADLAQAYARMVEQAAPGEVAQVSAPSPRVASAARADASSPPQSLAGLAAYLAQRPRGSVRNDGTVPPRDVYPELAALDEFRALWTRLGADKQMQQSLEKVPENAGPLNSNHLVHRSLSMMRSLSPGYLHQFLSYVDALSALEQLCNVSDPAGQLLARLDGARKSGRGKAR
ncbi:DUF2894 domain-containing protein [Bordetella genomosp. 13]|nr:DUF2894 domain-containing protein [Bordetella genomosp. 13]